TSNYIVQNCGAVMMMLSEYVGHLNSVEDPEFSGATKPNSSWSQTQLTRPIVALPRCDDRSRSGGQSGKGRHLSTNVHLSTGMLQKWTKWTWTSPPLGR